MRIYDIKAGDTLIVSARGISAFTLTEDPKSSTDLKGFTTWWSRTNPEAGYSGPVQVSGWGTDVLRKDAIFVLRDGRVLYEAK